MIGLFTIDLDDVWFGVACDEKRVYGTAFAKSVQEVLSSLLDCLPFEFPFETFPKPSPFAQKVIFTMKSAYDGKGVSEDFEFAAENLSAYNRQVLEACAKIPVGYVSSYGTVAKVAGGSARSVGAVMAGNPFAPIVPCHRVIKSDFTLGGYGGGLKAKRELLVREKRGYTVKQEISVGGKKLWVFPVELVLDKLKKKK
jgi:methylated-DNA-[protein]-cysteine S-methyltransferase